MTKDVRVSGIRRLLNLPPSGRTLQRDVDDEIRFHIETRVADLVRTGMPADRARELAEREFGNVREAREELARVDRRRIDRERRSAWWETLGQDVTYAARTLRTQPGFALVVIVVLALGIGANVTMFGVIDRLLLQPPAHVVEPGRLMSVALVRSRDAGRGAQSTMSYPIYRDMQSADRAFESVAVYTPTNLVLGHGADAQELRGMRVTANYFSTLGVRPALGRFFLPDDEGEPTAPRIAVLGWGFWTRQLQGDRSVIGKPLYVGDDEYTIVGVAPRGFSGVRNERVDVWVPLKAGLTAKEYAGWLGGRQSFWLQIVGRLRPGVTVQQASAMATAALTNGWIRDGASPAEVAAAGRSIELTSVLPRDARRDSADAKVAVLLGAVSLLVLLIACANVANLQLARGIARQREVAVRIALGIDRARLVRQLVLETVLLSLAAGVAAIIVTVWGGGLVRAVILSADMAHASPIDVRLVAYTALAAFAAGVVAGVLPAIQSSRPAVADTLRAGARAGGPARARTRTALLVIQAALTVVFLVGAALFVRSLDRIRALPLGLEPDHVLVVSARTSSTRLTSAEVVALYRRLYEAARTTPGVESAALGISLPFSTAWAEGVSVPGLDSVPLTSEGGPYFNGVTGEFFTTIGTRIIRGRGITEADRGSSARVVVVNDVLAKLWWPNQDAIGHCIKVGGDTMPCAQVVGVVENARRFGLIEEPAVQFYVPIEQAPAWADARTLLVRPTGDPEKAIESLRRALRAKVPDAPFLAIESLEDSVTPQMRAWRLGATAFGVFGLLAVMVAALGLYSVLAYDVSRRIREMGVRVALGARAGDVGRMVIGRAFRVAALGAIVGFFIVIAAGPVVRPLLFETSARDPLAFLGAAAVLFAVAMLAAIAPTRRAARVDPIIALRAE